MSISALLVEDNADLAASVCEYLALKGVMVDHVDSAEAALTLIERQRYDALLFDIALAGAGDGLGLCQQVRALGIDTPVLMLTARDSLDDKLAGFDAGSDDYLVKPFVLAELASRVQSLAQWSSGQLLQLQVGDLVLDLNARSVKRAGQVLKLTPSGRAILEALLRASPQLVSREQLEQILWPDEAPDSSALKVHLYNLRQQVDKPFATKLIHTVPHKGVVLRVE